MKKTFLLACACAAATLFAGPRISVLGDSYSTFEGWIPRGNAIWYYNAPRNQNDVSKVEETWWHQAVKLLGGTLERNNSFSGATVCFTGYYKEDYTMRSFLTRAADLGDPEVILVCGATNDSWCGAPIGDYKYADWSRRDLFAFRPAMAKMCHELKAFYPRAKVYFILNSELKPEINDSVHEICRHYAIPCIDLTMIDKQKGHPSVAGMRAFAQQVANVVGKDVK